MIEEINQASPQIRKICRQHNVRRLEVFGSATNANFNSKTSDLDFLVEFGSFPDGGYADHYFGLLEDLRQLFGRPIDLVVSRAVRNPYLLQSINKSRELVYAA